MALRQKSKPLFLGVAMWSILLAGILAAGIYFFFFSPLFITGSSVDKRFQVEDLDPNVETGVLPGAPKDEKPPEDGTFSYRINANPVFKQDGTGGDIKVQNSSFNQYLLVLEIEADGVDGLIYQSKFIAPNQYISTADLQKVLPSGEYQATAYLNAVDADTLDLVDTLTCPLDITIQ